MNSPPVLSPPGSARTWLLSALLAFHLLLTTSLPAWAEPPPAMEPTALLEAARKDMEGLRTVDVAELDDPATQDFRKRALAVQTRADEAATAMAPELADVQARLTELGTPAAGIKESPDIASQRSQLMRAVSTLDSQVKLARLLAVEAEQAAAAAAAQRRSQFGARLGERTPSLLEPAFWKALGTDLPIDRRRFERWHTDLRAPVSAVTSGSWWTLAGAVVGVLLLATAVQRFLLHLTSTRVPAGRLRRSLHALGVVAISMLAPGLIARAVVVTVESGGPLAAPVAQLLGQVEALMWFGGFTAGLGAALLMPGRPSWRLPPIPDRTAHRLRWFPLAFAVMIVMGWASSRLSTAIGAGPATTTALHTLASLTYLMVLGVTLRRLRPRPTVAADTPADGNTGHHPDAPASEPLWLHTARTVARWVLGALLLAVLSGHVAFGMFFVNQLVWGLIVLGAAYLLAVLVDDLFMTLLAPTAAPADAAAGTDGASAQAPRTREQTAVLLSGLSRIIVGLFATVLLLAPYGEGPLELVRRADRINTGLTIGEISVKPAALLQAALVLVIGLLAVRLLKNWLAKRYMPTTRMDAGMRLSVTTLFGYAGGVAVIALAMSAVGVGLERVAWVASALSVGIGFGLQAVVQNFVSGLILLAERPVKVGDWVSLSGVEGDIRRINVRATEIQMGDRSTVIVPNSEFITKIVRNVTYTDPLGMAQIKLPMPLATDTRKAREVLLAVFQAHPGVLPTPAPNVQLDGIDGTNLIFNASGFVSSPRAAYGVRSDLLFEVLERLREAGLSLGKAPTMLVASGTELPGLPVGQPTPNPPPP